MQRPWHPNLDEVGSYEPSFCAVWVSVTAA
jgi:hypothetical protein